MPLVLAGCLFGEFSGCVNDDGEVGVELTLDVEDCFCDDSGFPTEISCAQLIGSETFVGEFTSPFNCDALEFFDPLVAQVPSDATNFVGVFQNQTTMMSGSLVIQSGLTCIDTAPGEQICAEPGNQLLIIDFPPGVIPAADGMLSINFTVNLGFEVGPPRPIPLKAIVTGRLESGGQTYYPVIFPCVDSFADVPSVTIPRSSDLVSISLPSLDGLEACSGSLDFSPAVGVSMGAPAMNPWMLFLLAVGLVGLGIYGVHRADREKPSEQS